MNPARCARTASAPLRPQPLLVALCLLLASGTGAAADPSPDSSLLPAGGYPGPSCGSKPMQPFAPVSIQSSNQAMLYQQVVERFNAQSKAYTDCINAYLDTAAADAQRIQAQMDAAVAAANAK